MSRGGTGLPEWGFTFSKKYVSMKNIRKAGNCSLPLHQPFERKTMDHTPIILASASPRRKEILSLMGIDAAIMPSEIQEIRHTDDPKELVKSLAFQKALDVARRISGDAIVIGADTIVYFEGEILGKPSSHDMARKMLEKMSGKSHQVFTGVALLQPQENKKNNRDTGDAAVNNSFQELLALCKEDEITWLPGFKALSFVQESQVEFYPLSPEELTDYALSPEPMDKAGAYAVQGRFARYIREIRGDFYNIMGLPGARLYHALKQFRT